MTEVLDGQYVSIPVIDFERLMTAVSAHLDRDADVSEITSGLEPRWSCARDLKDCREEAAARDRELGYCEAFNYDLTQEIARLERRIAHLTGQT